MAPDVVPGIPLAGNDLLKELDSLSKPLLTSVFRLFHTMVVQTLSGSELECPFCKSTFSRFLSFGEKSEAVTRWKIIGSGFRLNSMCPSCFSRDRERLLYLYLKHETTIFLRPAQVLHIAPEKRLTRVLTAQPHLNYLSADLKEKDVMMNVDITGLPFDEASFDLVICSHVLEHIPNDRAAMAEIYRVLKSPGMALLQVPISWEIGMTYEDPAKTTSEERQLAFGHSGHVRIYGRDYVDRLQEAGFTVDVFDAGKHFGNAFVARNCLIEDEKLFIGRKITCA